MPWLSEAKKDVISCEKPRGVANTPRCADVRMGQPTGSDSGILLCRKRTRGTETSKYPEEEKENSIPPVAASEEGKAQTSFSELGL